MAVILVLILGLILWGLIGNREEQEKEKRIAREKREDMEAKVQEAEALIPKVASSAFYKEASACIRTIIERKKENIRWSVITAYNAYRAKCSGSINFLNIDDISWHAENDCIIFISSSWVYECDIEGDISGSESNGTAFIFSNHGYADLTKSQWYAFTKVVLQDFGCFSMTDRDLRAEIFDKGCMRLSLRLTPEYNRSIAKVELQRLQSEHTPYKNAF